MKKILNLIVLILLTITSMLIFKSTNKVDAATTIKAGKWYQAEVCQTTGIQYNYKVPSSGYFYYEIVPEKGYYQDEETGEWWETKFDEHFCCIDTGLGGWRQSATEDIRDFRGGVGVDTVWEKYESNKYSVKPGKKVILFFNNGTRNKYVKMQFRFRVVYKKIKNFEKENNDSLKKTNIIKKGKVYTGVLIPWEEDWFTFKSSKTKKYKIKVKLTENLDNNEVEAGICRGKAYIGRKLVYPQNGWKTVFLGKIKKGQTVSVRLIKYYNKSAMYKLKAQ